MVEKTVSVVPLGQPVASVCREGGSRYVEELPLEVVTLLEVFARIEARRQARLHDEQQGEVS
jgi:hypothetical protein